MCRGKARSHLITQYRHDSNLRTQLRRIVKKAGFKPWPWITHNLRASRATELAQEQKPKLDAASLPSAVDSASAMSKCRKICRMKWTPIIGPPALIEKSVLIGQTILVDCIEPVTVARTGCRKLFSSVPLSFQQALASKVQEVSWLPRVAEVLRNPQSHGLIIQACFFVVAAELLIGSNQMTFEDFSLTPGKFLAPSEV